MISIIPHTPQPEIHKFKNLKILFRFDVLPPPLSNVQIHVLCFLLYAYRYTFFINYHKIYRTKS